MRDDGCKGERPRVEAERLRRIWRLVEDIASHPGQTRLQLARSFCLSERQLQADLTVIREEMLLPLVRRRGYRFQDASEDAVEPISLAEAQLLLMLLRRAERDPALPAQRLRELLEKLPALLPAHLRPLVARTLQAARDEGGHRHEIFATLADALLQRSYVKLYYPSGDAAFPMLEPIVQPEVLVPFHSTWHVIGHCLQRDRVMVFDLDPVIAVSRAGAFPVG